jgi:predicted amino acid racemase
MTAPRLEVNLEKIHHNAQTLVHRLERCDISVMGVTKAGLGSPEIAGAYLRAGITALGDSRIENIEAMRFAGLPPSIALIRSPMLSQADRVVASAAISFNTELDVISALSTAAQKATLRHGVVLMVELGDLREGIMPEDLEKTVRETLRFPNIDLKGIGANLACRNGVSPDARNMAELSALADSVDAIRGQPLDIVSGGNSGNLGWALSGVDTGRINQLRLGESLLLGLNPLHREPIDGLHTDAITLTAEVIEAKIKPALPWGDLGQSAFGKEPPIVDRSGSAPGAIIQAILAVGRQDIDPEGLTPPSGIEILSASSDHLIVGCREHMAIGAKITFQLNYSALLRAMTSPFVTKEFEGQRRDAFLTPMAPVGALAI